MPLAKPTVTQIQELAARYPSKQSAIIPALWAVQHEQGYVTDAAMSEIAQHLGLPPSLIEATASFYSMFLTRPEGRHDMVICVNAPCMLRGADEMAGYHLVCRLLLEKKKNRTNYLSPTLLPQTRSSNIN